MQQINDHKRAMQKTCVVGVMVLWLLALAACGNTGTGQTSSDQPTPTPLPTPIIPEKPTYTVQSGTVVRTLEFIGRASPFLEQELFFRADGFVGEVFVERGDWVQAGDVLAELEISNLETQLVQQQLSLRTSQLNLAQAEQDLADNLYLEQISLEKAQIKLQQTLLGDSNVAILSAEINLAQAQNALADAQEAYYQAWDPARDWELYKRGGNLESEREAATDNLASAQDSLKLAQAEYNETLSSNQASNYDLRTLELDIAVIEFNIEQLERGVDPMLNLDLEKVQLEIEDLERQITDARLIAPFDGQILSVSIDPGDQASAFSVVMVLADPSELEITAELGAEELSEMALGQEALITLRNRPEETFGGSVRQLPYPYGGGTTDASDDDLAAHISIEAGVELELGELATVAIVLEEKENVLWLPPAAIRTFQGRDFVVVQLDEGQKRVDVLVGIVTDERVEIVQGLEEGQVIVGE
jgi:multidrug efflux pump subunit AcrA (membrane-fusion protein)